MYTDILNLLAGAHGKVALVNREGLFAGRKTILLEFED